VASALPVEVDLPLEPAVAPGLQADAPHAQLESLVVRVEQRLGALSDSLRERDVQAIEQQAQELHRALAQAVESFMHAARNGGVPEAMRLRLAHASAQLARQREALSRATAALDRAIDVLMPGAAPAGRVYTASGLRGAPLHGGTNLNA
jgi:exonuclease VII large subunit